MTKPDIEALRKLVEKWRNGKLNVDHIGDMQLHGGKWVAILGNYILNFHKKRKDLR